MFTIGHDQINKCPPLGDTVKCRNCGKMHNVEFGKTKDKNGVYIEDKAMGFISCPESGSAYLVGIGGKDITGTYKT